METLWIVNKGEITRHQAAFHLLSILDKTVRYDNVRSRVRKESTRGQTFAIISPGRLTLEIGASGKRISRPAGRRRIQILTVFNPQPLCSVRIHAIDAPESCSGSSCRFGIYRFELPIRFIPNEKFKDPKVQWITGELKPILRRSIPNDSFKPRHTLVSRES